GRLVISGPPQVGALATIVGRRGGWHTISTTPEPGGRMRGFVRREARGRSARLRANDPSARTGSAACCKGPSQGAGASVVAARETSVVGGSPIGPTGSAWPVARSTV